MAKQRVFVLGLDAVPPSLLKTLKGGIPNLTRFLETSEYGPLESTHPPITCPAWATMATGKDPGELGVYGFRNRTGPGYDHLKMVSSRDIQAPSVWDLLSQRGKEVIVVAVPPGYPPKPVKGYFVSCFLTPGHKNSFTYPEDFKEELLKISPKYKFDVMNFRTPEKERILKEIYELTDQHFKLVHHFLKTKPWDFFMFTEIATDRLHHAFWKYFDSSHPKHDSASKFKDAIPDYYRYLDSLIGKTFELLDDKTTVFVVSDHGSKAIHGGIGINEFLIREGYLVLKQEELKKNLLIEPTLLVSPCLPAGNQNHVIGVSPEIIDWKKTRAWGEGGYYARVFINKKGREPEGIVLESEFEPLKLKLREKLQAIPDENGNTLDTKVLFPEEIYPLITGIPPDLMVYFDNLNWRAIGTIGYPSLYVSENDTGPDDSNHSQDGVYAFKNSQTQKKKVEGMKIHQISQKILEVY
ncbi:MAG: alkaline phosphatase family protein [Candidatus Eremiobacteraeota bacterium]|jgi:predicted AlkP superfamily phosphohydrolase/phosphomutase|nr:alkaline phosphatase family protein [Candidatus Eremiobacteraeota bacterium]MCL5055110.1 alkaline phosphatase family protein [Bacillota bacterium]